MRLGEWFFYGFKPRLLIGIDIYHASPSTDEPGGNQ
jgi:hypothetical protein